MHRPTRFYQTCGTECDSEAKGVSGHLSRINDEEDPRQGGGGQIEMLHADQQWIKCTKKETIPSSLTALFSRVFQSIVRLIIRVRTSSFSSSMNGPALVSLENEIRKISFKKYRSLNQELTSKIQ